MNDLNLKVTGDTRSLDAALQRSAQRQAQIAQMTAREMGSVNAQMDRDAVANFERMSVRANAAGESASRPFVRLRENMRLFGNVALNTGSVVGVAMGAIVVAARAATQALAEARAAAAEANKTGGGSVLGVSQALASAGVRDVARVQREAAQARGSASQEQIDAFVGRFGELTKAGVQIDDDEAIDLIRTYARNQAVLGDGSSLLAARALRGRRPAARLADAAVGFRVRTGEDLSLAQVTGSQEAIARAQAALEQAEGGVADASRGGSVAALRSAQERRAQAADALAGARAGRSRLFDATAEAGVGGGAGGMAAAAMAGLGTPALREVGLRTAERELEIQRTRMGALPEAERERLDRLRTEGAALRRDVRRLTGDNAAGANIEAVLSRVPGLGDRGGSEHAQRQLDAWVQAQQEGTAALVDLVHEMRQTRPLRPEAHRE